VKEKNNLNTFISKSVNMKFLLIILGCFFINLFTFSQELKTVNTQILNLRNGAGTEFEIIHQLHYGDTVKAFSTIDTWTEIESKTGIKGYVSSQFLSKCENSVAKNTSTSKKNDSWFIYLFFGIVGLILLNTARKTLLTSNVSKKGPFNSRKLIKDNSQSLPVHICRYCGKKENDIWKLTHQTCIDSPTKKHHPLEGGPQAQYICEYCGKKENDLWKLTHQTCLDSPTKKHQPFIGGIQNIYVCQYCGKKDNDLWKLTHQTCINSPTNKHKPHF